MLSFKADIAFPHSLGARFSFVDRCSALVYCMPEVLKTSEVCVVDQGADN